MRAIALPFLGLAGCAATLDAGRGKLLEPGVVEAGVGLAISSVEANVNTEAPAQLPWFTPTGTVRVGLHERVELGGSAWAMGWPHVFTTLGGSIRVLTPIGDLDRQHPQSTGLRLTYHRLGWGGAGHHILGADIPWNLDLPAGRHAWTMSPRVGIWSAWGKGQAPIVHPSIGFGAAFRARVGERLTISPAVALAGSPVGFDGAAGDGDRRGLSSFELGIGFSWRRRDAIAGWAGQAPAASAASAARSGLRKRPGVVAPEE